MVDSRKVVLALCLPVIAACHGSSSGSSGDSTSQILGNVSFETRTEQPAGLERTVDADLADLTGDGIVDIVVVGQDGGLQILVGQGGGTFVPSLSPALQIGGTPIAVRVGNLDRNLPEASPLADIVVVSADPDQVTVLINDGAGNFTISAQFAAGVIPDAVLLGECTGDNNPDLVVTHLSNNDVLIYPGNGDGTFGEPRSLFMPEDSRTSGLASGDVNQDGIPDVLICDIDNDRIILFPGLPDAFGQASGFHGGPIPIAVGLKPLDIAIGDLNMDGVADIAVSNFDSQTIDILSHLGNNQFTIVDSLQVDGKPAQLLVGDVSGDGIPDVVVSVLDRSTVAVFKCLPSGGFAPEEQLGASGNPFRPICADLNQDDLPDLVVPSVSTNRLNIYFGQEKGLTGAKYHRTGLSRPDFVVAADLLGDGTPFLVSSSLLSTQVAIMRAEEPSPFGDPVLRTVLIVEMNRLVRNVVAADINKDGKTDLLVAIDGGVKILANESSDGEVRFRQIPEATDMVLAPGSGAFEMVGRDINGDSLIDIVVAYLDEDRVSLLISAGTDFVFTAPRSVVIVGGPLGLTTGDFDGDLDIEIAVTSRDDSVLSIIDMNSEGNPEVESVLPVGSQPNFVRTADFNQDGRDDMVLSNGESDTVEVLISIPGGGFQSILLEAGRRPTALLATDLNRDGCADILFTSHGGADFRIALGDGDGGFHQTLIFPGALGASSAVLTDLNGDGLEDLVVASIINRRLAVFRNISSSDN